MTLSRSVSMALLVMGFATICGAQDSVIDDMDGPSGRLLAGQYISMGTYRHPIEYVEQQSADILSRRSRAADGTWELAGMYDGYATMLRYEGDWEKALENAQAWRTAFPKSRTAPVAEATYWLAYARLARGGDFANQVPKKAWELYNARLKKALEVLESTKLPENPHWYSQMLDVAYALQWPSKEQRDLFKEAVAKEPYYYTHYFRVANHLTPRWGGSLREYDAFVEESVERTRERDGSTMYARLYWILASVEWDREPFSDLGIPWPKMRQGFDDLMKRYPKSKWNLNNYAYFACRAQDVKTFTRIAREIDRPIAEAWSGSYTLDYCKERLFKRA